MKRFLVYILVVFFIVGCAAPRDGLKKSSYEMPKKMDTSDITIENILKSDKLLDQGKIVVTGEIDERVSKEVITKLFYLDKRGFDHIDLYIRTTGGWLNDAFAIVDAMNSIKTPVNVHAMGLCQSAGTIILIGATGKRIGYAHSDIAPHFNRSDDNTPGSQARLDRERFEHMWRTRTKIPESWYPLTGNRMPHFSAKEAMKLGIIDEVR